MPLKKFLTIKRVGRFANSTASGNVELKRYSLIFAENGRGKTTLCAVLRSLQTGAAEHILGRATLGNTEPQEVSILLDGGTATFAAGSWNQTLPDLAIFDGTFIAENVFAGDHVDVDHKKNLYRIIVGARGVTLARQVDDFDTRIRTSNSELRDLKNAVQLHIPHGVPFETFLTLPAEPGVDAAIESKQRELDAAQQADQIQQKPTLGKIECPVFPEGYAGLLAKTLDGIAADSERKIAEHLAKHEFVEKGEVWLTEGLKHIKESCPFCGQSITGIDLIAAYRAYFSAAYNALRGEISAQIERIGSDFGDRAIANTVRIIEQNTTNLEFWNRYCSIALEPLAVHDLESALRGLRQTALTLLERKSHTPLERIDRDAGLTAAEEVYRLIAEAARAYNTAVDAANLVIAGKKEEAARSHLGTVESELTVLRAKKTRHEVVATAACQAYQDKVAEKADLERQKIATKRQLDEHTSQVINQYEASINTLLERFNTGFTIGSTTHNYRGGTPTSSYEIVINRRAVELGDADTPLNQPSFKNTLSGGDKSALALAFFLAQLEQDADRAGKIVVFDDPFTSQDRFRRLATALQIKHCGDQCAQVVVLSHEPIFLKEVWDTFPAQHRKTLTLTRVADVNTLIREWDIEEALRDRYRTDIEALQKYCDTGEGDPRQIVRRIRPVVEGYCRKAHPVDFDGRATLGAIIGKIREVGADHPLHVLLDELNELNIYSRRYHHPDGPEPAGAVAEPIDNTELTGYTRRTLRIAGCL
jgi:wobble nucleotide-excising tRNase